MERAILFPIMQRLKKAGVPVKSYRIENTMFFNDKYKKQYAIFKADSWAVKLAQHPFNGCNPCCTIWNSNIRGTAEIVFRV